MRQPVSPNLEDWITPTPVGANAPNGAGVSCPRVKEMEKESAGWTARTPAFLRFDPSK